MCLLLCEKLSIETGNLIFNFAHFSSRISTKRNFGSQISMAKNEVKTERLLKRPTMAIEKKNSSWTEPQILSYADKYLYLTTSCLGTRSGGHNS